FQAEDGIRDFHVTGVQTCALPIWSYFYPSVSLSWLANYTFNMPSNITLLKLRGGFAQVGNDTHPYQLNNALGTGSWGDLITTNKIGRASCRERVAVWDGGVVVSTV